MSGLSGLSNHSCERNFFFDVGPLISAALQLVRTNHRYCNVRWMQARARRVAGTAMSLPIMSIHIGGWTRAGRLDRSAALHGGRIMALVIEGEERIAAPVRKVWEALNDPAVLEGLHPRVPEPGEDVRHGPRRDRGAEDRADQGDVCRRGRSPEEPQPAACLHHFGRGQGRHGRLRQGRRRCVG